MRSDHLREVVLPDEKILVIGPWRLVPQISITTGSPADSRNASAFYPREDCREGGRNCGVERLTRIARSDKDVVAGARELKFVNRRGTQVVC